VCGTITIDTENRPCELRWPWSARSYKDSPTATPQVQSGASPPTGRVTVWIEREGLLRVGIRAPYVHPEFNPPCRHRLRPVLRRYHRALQRAKTDGTPGPSRTAQERICSAQLRPLPMASAGILEENRTTQNADGASGSTYDIKSDIQNRTRSSKRPSRDRAKNCGISSVDLLPYGTQGPKVSQKFINSVQDRPRWQAHLGTATNPNPRG